jgi:hypothetical protein
MPPKPKPNKPHHKKSSDSESGSENEIENVDESLVQA